MSRTNANFILLLAGFVWGLGFVAQATAMQHIGPFQFVGLRFLLATLVVAPLAWYEYQNTRIERDSPTLKAKDWYSLILVGTIFATMMILQQIGLLATSVTNAGMLTGLYVIFTPIIALLFLRQNQPAFIWPAAGLAFLGIWLLGGGGLSNFTWGDAIVILSAMLAALQVILVGAVGTKIGRPVLVAASQFAVTAFIALMGLLVARAVEWKYEPALSLQTLLGAAPEILYAAVFAGALAFTLQAIGQRHTGSGDAAVLLSSEALFAALAGAILLAERLEAIGYVGCICLFSAICIVAYLSAKAEEKKTTVSH